MVDKARQQQAVENELARERANGLGLTGQSLAKALERYEAHVASGRADGAASQELLGGIVERAHALLLQREAHGLQGGNLEWLRGSYRLPEAVIVRLLKLHR